MRRPPHHVALGIAIGVLCCGPLLVAGCASEGPPPATIREFNEPTDTVDQLVDGTETGSVDATGSLSGALRDQLEKQVQLLGVSYAADGGYLMVSFQASPRLAILWQPGELYLIDEATGAKYADIPLMPKIGRLIGRPVQEGQPGYVMLLNRPPLKPGSSVTVVLGGFRQKHATVEASNAPAPAAP